jgi:hypothetical protein
MSPSRVSNLRESPLDWYTIESPFMRGIAIKEVIERGRIRAAQGSQDMGWDPLS